MLICAICGEPNSFLFAVEQHIAERLQSNLLVALTNQEGNIIVEGIFLARDLVNERAIVMTPKKLAGIAKEELEAVGVEVEVFGKKKFIIFGLVVSIDI